MKGERVAPDRLRSSAACLVLALLPLIGTLPVWVLFTSGAAVGIRVLLASRGRDAPPGPVRAAVALLAIGLLFLQFHTFNGIAAGTALLCLMAGLKLLETRTDRDLKVALLIVFFLSLAELLSGNSFAVLAYLIGVSWLTIATLLRFTVSKPPPAWATSLRCAARMLLHALPLTLLLWLFFPRFDGPLWQARNEEHGAESGLSDTLSPGDITDLALSDEVAFRVHFVGNAPPHREFYWRGPVLSIFDGRTWRRDATSVRTRVPASAQAPAYRYTLNLEPHGHRWVFLLDWPTDWDLPRAQMTADSMLLQRYPVTQPIEVTATSTTDSRGAEPLSIGERTRDTYLPAKRNPRTLRFARNLRAEHPDDLDFVRAVLALFHEQAYFYTLSPPLLGDEPIDEFLFDTRRGFCGHYASAFAVLMRDAGIPVRVVTGYLGGSFNRYADYWIVRQSDAHAWDEVWINGSGWQRFDPTGAIAPERVDRALRAEFGAEELSAAHDLTPLPWLTDLKLRIDAVRELWRERILQFDQRSQESLLERLMIPEPDEQKLVLVLAASLILALGWLTWQVARELKPADRDAVVRAYARLCAKLAASGLPRMPHEGAETYAARVSDLRPQLAAAVTSLCARYTALRYGERGDAADLKHFQAAVRAFRAR